MYEAYNIMDDLNEFLEIYERYKDYDRGTLELLLALSAKEHLTAADVIDLADHSKKAVSKIRELFSPEQLSEISPAFLATVRRNW